MTEPIVTREPTILLGLCSYLSAAAGGFATTRVDTDLQDRVTAHGHVIEVRRTGGQRQSWQEFIDLTVYVYAASHAALWGACEAVAAALDGPRINAGGWRIDNASSLALWAEQPHPNLRTAVASFRITTRDL